MEPCIRLYRSLIDETSPLEIAYRCGGLGAEGHACILDLKTINSYGVTFLF